jgi:hypothetical protein
MKDNHELAMEQFAAQQTWMEKTGGFARDMTLRDHFAGLALQGFLAYAATTGKYAPPDDELARESYKMADAMMKARNGD